MITGFTTKRRLLCRLVAMLALIFTLAAASTQMRADTGTCSGQMISVPFIDVSGGNIFFCPIAEAYFSGLTNGTTATTYSPTQPVPREQMAAFITRTQDSGLRRGNRRAALNQWATPTSIASTAKTTVGDGPLFVQSDGKDLWVANNLSGTVSRVRASDGRLLETWTGADDAGCVLVARGRIYITGTSNPGRLYAIDPDQPAGPVITVTSSLGAFPYGLTTDGIFIWTANSAGSVSKFSPDLVLVETFTAGFSNPLGILYDGANIWITDDTDNSLKKLNADDGSIAQTISVGTTPRFPVFDGANIWVPNLNSASVTVVRAVGPLAGTVLATLTGNGLAFPYGTAFDGQRILVTNFFQSSLSLWKAADLTPLGFFSTGGNNGPAGGCSDGINFWIALNSIDRRGASELSIGVQPMSYNSNTDARAINRFVSLCALIVLLVASTRLRADTGMCGGQNLSLPFNDVPANNIFFCSIAAAFFSGLTNGTSSTTYSPAQNVPREQMAAFITRTQDSVLRRGSMRAALNQWSTPSGISGTATTLVGDFPQLVQSDGADLWVANQNSGTVSRVRASDGRLLDTWTGATYAYGVLVARGRIYVTAPSGPNGHLYGFDPDQPAGPVLSLVNLPANTFGITTDGFFIWTANVGGSVSKFNPDTVVVQSFTAGFNEPWGILYDGANIWVTDSGDHTLKRLNSDGSIAQTINVGTEPRNPIFDGTNIWVPNSFSDSVTVVRAVGPLAGTVLATLTGNGLVFPLTAAFDGERILVTNFGGDSVSLWKAADLTPLGTINTGANTAPIGTCSDGINFWITLSGTQRLARF